LARVDRAVACRATLASNPRAAKTLRGDLEQVSLASVALVSEARKENRVLLLWGTMTARIYIDAGTPAQGRYRWAESGNQPANEMGDCSTGPKANSNSAHKTLRARDELRHEPDGTLLEHARRRMRSRSNQQPPGRTASRAGSPARTRRWHPSQEPAHRREAIADHHRRRTRTILLHRFLHFTICFVSLLDLEVQRD